MKRSDIVKHAGTHVVGIELGVAEGEFSDQVLSEQPAVSKWYSVDMWAGDRGHDVHQRTRAQQRLQLHGDRSVVIHARFADALDRFSDHYFDFVYIDGYAHTGQDGGQTLTDWWPKLKPGGVFAGDDYHPDWPLTVKSVDDFVAAHSLQLHIHRFDQITHWSRHPSWYVFKPKENT